MTTLMLLLGLAGILVQPGDGQPGTPQDAQEEEQAKRYIFEAEQEVPKIRGQVEQDAPMVGTVLQKIQEKVGSSPGKILESVEGLQSQLQEARKSANSEAAQQQLNELGDALEILRRRQMQQLAEQAAMKRAGSALEGKIPEWALNIQRGVLSANSAGVGEPSVDTLGQAFDGGRSGLPGGRLVPAAGTRFFRGRFRTAAELEGLQEQVAPQKEKALSMADQAQALAGELGVNQQQIRSAEHRIRELKSREAALKSQPPGKTGAGSAEALQAELNGLKAEAGRLKLNLDSSNATLDDFLARNQKAKAQCDAWDKEMETDGDAFYEKNKADCYEVPGSRVTQPDGSSTWKWRYRPRDILGAEVQRTHDSWQKEKTTRDQINLDLAQTRQQITQIDISLREARRRMDLEQAINQLKTETKSVNDLKARRSEILSLYQRLMESLRSTAAKIRGWAERAKEAARRLNE